MGIVARPLRPCAKQVRLRSNRSRLPGDLRADHGAVALVTRASDAALLRELIEAAEAVRDLPPLIYAQAAHYETDEVSCCCGFVSQASDYEAARASLRRHINRKVKEKLVEREAVEQRYSAALTAAKEALS